MKKTLVALVMIFFSLSSFLYLQAYSDKEFLNIVEGNGNVISIKSNLDPKETIKTINEASMKFETTIFKKEYELNSNSINEGAFKLYLSQFTDGLMKKIKYKNMKGYIKNNKFISAQKHDDINQIGMFHILHKQSGVDIKSLDEAALLNLNTEFYLTTTDDVITYQIINFLNTEGILADVYNGPRAQAGSYEKIFMLISIIVILIILTLLYKFILEFKYIAVKKLNGYSDRIIQKEYAISFLKINCILECILTLLFCGISIFIYRTLNLNFIIGYFITMNCLTLILCIIYYMVSFFVRCVDIAPMLKNKKPLKELQIVNFVAVIVFLIIVINVSITSLTNIAELIGQNTNISYWNSSKHFAFTTVTGITYSNNGNFYKEGKKMQNFYKLMDENESILFFPSSYYLVDDDKNNPYILQDGTQYKNEFISINENYLKLNPIKDVHDNNVVINNHGKNCMTILIPEKYMDQKEEIEQTYRDEYRELRYYDENLYRESTGQEPIKETTYVDFIYVKNGQRYFSYNPDLAKENDNFINDPIVKIYTDDNQGTDVYLSLISQGALFIKVKDNSKPYTEIKPSLIQTNLITNIRSTPSLYSKFSEKIYTLYMKVLENIISLFFSFVTMAIITLFMTTNYLEKNKIEHAVKAINGYSFFARHSHYIIENSIVVLILGLTISLFTHDYRRTAIVTCILFIIHILGIMLILKVRDFKGIRDTLKGN